MERAKRVSFETVLGATWLLRGPSSAAHPSSSHRGHSIRSVALECGSRATRKVTLRHGLPEQTSTRVKHLCSTRVWWPEWGTEAALVSRPPWSHEAGIVTV